MLNLSCAASVCYGYANKGNMIAAASDSFWNNGVVCGRCYLVKCTGAAYGGAGNPCTGNSVTVKIVDHCASSDGCQSTIDLSKQAFAKIANLDAGEVKVTYNPTYVQTVNSLSHFSLSGRASGHISHTCFRSNLVHVFSSFRGCP